MAGKIRIFYVIHKRLQIQRHTQVESNGMVTEISGKWKQMNKKAGIAVLLPD